jgi:hypothetical protein
MRGESVTARGIIPLTLPSPPCSGGEGIIVSRQPPDLLLREPHTESEGLLGGRGWAHPVLAPVPTRFAQGDFVEGRGRRSTSKPSRKAFRGGRGWAHPVLAPVPDEVCAGRLCRGEGETEHKQTESEQGLAPYIRLRSLNRYRMATRFMPSTRAISTRAVPYWIGRVFSISVPAVART